MTEEEIIDQAFCKNLMGLFDVFFTGLIGDDAPTGAARRFRTGLLTLRDTREQALAIIREQL